MESHNFYLNTCQTKKSGWTDKWDRTKAQMKEQHATVLLQKHT